jgi:hypothetical protein
MRVIRPLRMAMPALAAPCSESVVTIPLVLALHIFD